MRSHSVWQAINGRITLGGSSLRSAAPRPRQTVYLKHRAEFVLPVQFTTQKHFMLESGENVRDAGEALRGAGRVTIFPAS